MIVQHQLNYTQDKSSLGWKQLRTQSCITNQSKALSHGDSLLLIKCLISMRHPDLIINRPHRMALLWLSKHTWSGVLCCTEDWHQHVKRPAAFDLQQIHVLSGWMYYQFLKKAIITSPGGSVVCNKLFGPPMQVLPAGSLVLPQVVPLDILCASYLLP